ncbi:MAG: hemerythrin domain-containing protein [Alphaproteobacteria bacterium]|nr:hemerythrin domain-containing protein [Alphaproteobacteria bacterium]
MNIYNYLKKDHRAVDEIFQHILSTKSLKKRESLFEEVAKELLLHIETENATFYNALREYEEIYEKIEHADKEHEEVKEYISRIRGVSIENEKWMELFGEFKHSVTHHVEEEEGDIFDLAKEVLSTEEANELAKEMDALKGELMAA